MSNPLLVGDIVQTRSWSSDAEQAAVNVLNWRVLAVGGVPATDRDMATSIDAIYATILPLFSANVTYNGTEAQIISPTVLTGAVSTASAGTGTDGANSLPRQTSGLTSWYALKGGRKYRGRTFWPFPGGSYYAIDGKPSSAYVSAIDALAGALFAVGPIGSGGRSATMQMIIWHRPTKTVPGSYDLVVTRQTRPIFATQRRRGSEGRANRSPI